jgi:hypothetical protein
MFLKVDDVGICRHVDQTVQQIPPLILGQDRSQSRQTVTPPQGLGCVAGAGGDFGRLSKPLLDLFIGRSSRTGITYFGELQA